jgi:K+ transporter
VTHVFSEKENATGIKKKSKELLRPSLTKYFSVFHFSVLTGADQMVWISVAILVVLFAVQRFGTDKVGYSFAPIILLWFMFIAGIGIYNLVEYDIGVLRAFYPKYIVDYFRRNGRDAWVSLGGILLCFTGEFQ